MNAAKLEKSDRLQRVDALLSDGREYSTLDICIGANVCAVNSAIAELRAHPNNRVISCRRIADVWYYRRAV